eukprot:TRINITY_DN6315_c0_g1_i1.p1 TRINITY_DN6315_c0_g1~~TRINITY_DN6315_c0_g1_i1.p1  ORF type:complete len:117 (-),score=28.33 TRINITY_DN6315_c0_g1_i1:189-539(-)
MEDGEIEEPTVIADSTLEPPAAATAPSTLTPEQQENAARRAATLQAWIDAIGKPIRLDLHEEASVRGTLTAVDSRLSRIHVSQLQTPMFLYPEALVRTSDVVLVEVLTDPPQVLSF